MSADIGAELDAVEEVDGVIVVDYVRPLPVRRTARQVVATHTAMAATGLVAGAAAAVVVAQRRARRSAAQTAPRRSKSPAANVLGIESTRTFLIDVHTLTKRP